MALLAVAAVCAALAAPARAQSADLILRGGAVFLGPGRRTTAVAVTGNRVTALGGDAEIAAVKGPRTRVIELEGRAVVAGFHDAGARVMAGAETLYRLDVSSASTPAELRRLVDAYAAGLPRDAWVVGGHLREAAFAKAAVSPLDVLASTRPVVLSSRATLWANAAALRRAGLQSSTGVLKGADRSALLKRIPLLTRPEKLAALRLALALMREEGVTAVDELPYDNEPPADEFLSLWRELAQRGEATARLVLYGRLEDPAGYVKARASALDLPRTRVLLPGVAAALDGDLADRTSALLEPYFDAPETRGGSLRLSGFELTPKVRAAMNAGLQVALRASGDRAVRAALDVCAKVAPEAGDRGAVLPRYPCRVDGADAVADEDLKRFKKLSVAVVASPAALVFEDEVVNYYADRLGDAVKRAMPLRSLEQAGALVAFSSGWPEAPLSPLRGLFGAVARRNEDGKPAQGLAPAQRLSTESALDRSANDGWELAGLGDELGDIRLGRIADLVVLDRDVLSKPPSLDARVDVTIFDGRVVYERAP